MIEGIHIVRAGGRKPGEPVRWYIYAWRGGPRIHSQTGGCKPQRLTPAAQRAFDEAVKARGKSRTNTGLLAAIIDSFASSSNPDWAALAPATRRIWSAWLRRIKAKFGAGELAAFEDRRTRKLIIDWRDQWAHSPRSADYAIQVFRRLLGWAKARGEIASNILEDVPSLYRVNRSDHIWEPQHIEAMHAWAARDGRHTARMMAMTLDLACATGLRLSDLARLTESHVCDQHGQIDTSKSRRRRKAVFPRTAALDTALAALRAYRAGRIAADPARPLPSTLLFGTQGQPYLADSLGQRFGEASRAAGVTGLHLHDCRGTYATRLMAEAPDLSDETIGKIMGIAPDQVGIWRERYIDMHRVVVALGERLRNRNVKQV